MYLKIIILSVILIGLAIAGIAIKMFFKKDGEFKKKCSSIDPETGKALGCTCEGSPGDGSCKTEDKTYKHENFSPALQQIKELEVE